jgi:hypothetical protein
MDLHPNEAELIYLMRNRTRFGMLEVTVKDGLPLRVTRRVDYFQLTVDNRPFDEPEEDATIKG